MSDTKTIRLFSGEYAIVDAKNHDWLSMYSWHSNRGYVVTNTPRVNGKATTQKMHRLVMKAKRGDIVDHINRNKLDNTEANLRIATHQESNMNIGLQSNNSSGFKGVCWDKRKNKFMASVMCSGKRSHVGYFSQACQAAVAYDLAVLKMHGGHAFLNFPELAAITAPLESKIARLREQMADVLVQSTNWMNKFDARQEAIRLAELNNTQLCQAAKGILNSTPYHLTSCRYVDTFGVKPCDCPLGSARGHMEKLIVQSPAESLAAIQDAARTEERERIKKLISLISADWRAGGKNEKYYASNYLLNEIDATVPK